PDQPPGRGPPRPPAGLRDRSGRGRPGRPGRPRARETLAGLAGGTPVPVRRAPRCPERRRLRAAVDPGRPPRRPVALVPDASPARTSPSNGDSHRRVVFG